jgi:phage shock protein A
VSDAANLAKAERELGAARATLAEHVEENLALHRRCIELEEDNAKSHALIDAMERGGQDLLRRVAELEQSIERANATGQVDLHAMWTTELGKRRRAESKLAELRERTNGCPRCGGVVDRG